MITTGRNIHSGRKTEVVDVLTGETCADLADFPMTNYGGVGANLNGTPVVCGGQHISIYYQKCYKYTNTGYWIQFTSMKEIRVNAAGVIYKNKFHVFGGYGSSISQKTTELISIDGGVEFGPELPEAVQRHAITSINSTVSLLSGGLRTSAEYYSQTWYFNHETDVFSSGPSLLEARYDHGSATIVDKVTTAKIPIVTGGRNKAGYAGKLNSTELLINGMWQSGTKCKKGNIFLFALVLFVQQERALPFHFDSSIFLH